MDTKERLAGLYKEAQQEVENKNRTKKPETKEEIQDRIYKKERALFDIKRNIKRIDNQIREENQREVEKEARSSTTRRR